MRLLTLLLSGYFLLLGCLPPNTDAHEIGESLALRHHHEQAHHDSSLLDFLLDHYAGQHHRHDGDTDREHQSLPFHHVHDCPFALVAWAVAPVVVPQAPPAFRPGEAPAAAYDAGASAGIPSTCWQPPRV
ncbi:hypothetical protein [Hymenobacter sp.]|uniref:hypothetical protein n=1 Tax=Hymenobacter sp. TaxID=1898978 RepID=UPI00286CA8C3|nr:hypothetical protein [Hymenobacter sp.]